MTSEASGRWRAGAARLARFACLAYLFVAAFPGRSIPASPNLDGSWVLELNRIAQRGGFGPDFAFTYGPLTYLLHPALVGSHPEQAAALRFLVTGALVALTAWWARSAPTWRLAVFAAACALGAGTGGVFEYQLVLLFVLLGCVSVERRDGWLVLLLAAMSGVALFMKLTLGLASLAITLTALGARLVTHGRRAWAEALASAAVLGGIVALVATFVLGGVQHLGGWLSLSLEIAAAFSEAMSVASQAPGATLHLAVAIAAVIAFVAGALAWCFRPGPAGLAFLLAAGPVFLAYKHGFVRHGFAHTEMFFPFLLVLLALAMLRARGTWPVAGLAVTVLGASALSVQAAQAYGVMAEPPAPWASLAGARGATALSRWSRPSASPGWIQLDVSELHVPGLKEAAAGGLGVFPFELAICGANDVDCVIGPALQAYSAQTARLDQLTAEQLAGPRAPRLLYVWGDSIDGRSPIFDTPAAWREIRWRYALAATQPGPKILLTRAREERAPPLQPVRAFDVQPDAWNAAPAFSGARHLALDFQLTPWGRLRKLLYRIPQVVLVLRYSDGSEVPVRIVPDTARGGLAIDDYVEDGPAMKALLAGRPRAAVPVAFGLAGEGLRYYEQPVRARWLAGTTPR